jgi:hypothetical protein
MKWLVGNDVLQAVRAITTENKVRCAVAFWGAGAEALFEDMAVQKPQIICNLATGGTNPEVIQKLQENGATVRHHDRLHAKVYIGQQRAVIGSANASVNGLGLEAAEQAHWNEAAVEVDNPSEQTAWFKRLWKESLPVEAGDLERARELFRRRRRLASFEAFDTEMTPLPLVSWFNSAEGEVDRDRLRQDLGSDDDEAANRVEWGEQVTGDEDVRVLKDTHWVLRWRITSQGSASKKENPWWARIQGTLVRGAWRQGDDILDVVLGSEPVRGTEPFDPRDKEFVAAFREVIARPKFALLRETDYEGSFYTDARLDLTRQFWRTLKGVYMDRRQKAA